MFTVNDARAEQINLKQRIHSALNNGYFIKMDLQELVYQPQ